MSGSAGGSGKRTGGNADTAPRLDPDHPETMGFSHRARASNDRSVRRCIRSLRRSAPLALSASGLIAGENDVKHTPSLRRAPRGRKANPRKENEVCSCSPRRLLSLQ